MRGSMRGGAGPAGARYPLLALVLWLLVWPVQAAGALRETVLEIAVNGEPAGEALVVLRDQGQGLWLRAEDLARMRLKAPAVAPVEHGGRRYFPLRAIPGAVVRIDEARQRAIVRVPPAAFEPTRLHQGGGTEAPLTPAAPGAFLNYQVSGQRTAGQSIGGALAEIGLFGARGAVDGTWLAQAGGGKRRAIRLETTYTHDLPDALQTLTLGDAISSAPRWGNAVRFAGVRWGSNFALRPDLLTTPLIAISGNAVVPSTAQVFVNDQRVTSQSVPPGPFVIDRVPAVSGAGDVRLVLRDALGNEQVITQPFYSGSALLAPGLAQYAVDVGWIRENYALDSFDYGAPVASASYRRGITDGLTLEGHAEWLARAQRAAGLDLAVSTGPWGIVTATIAAGGDPRSSGWLAGVGFEHRGRRLSLLLDTLRATRGFRQIGNATLGTTPLRQRTLAQVGESLGRFGSLSVAWAEESFQASPAQRIVSLSYDVRAGGRGWLSIAASRSMGSVSSTSAYLDFTVSLGGRRTADVSEIVNRGAGANGSETFATVAETAPVGPGTGWLVGGGSAGSYDVDWQMHARSAAVELEAARMQGLRGERALVSGGVTWLDHDLTATRTLTDSFAVVDVDGIPGVPVYLDNQLVARTDANGHAILYDLRPYEPNRISVDPADLPLDTSLQSDRVVLRPPWRSGVVARFPIHRVQGATLRLLKPAGKPVPVGATVRYKGRAFRVGLDGLAYIEGFDGGSGAAEWDGHMCKFRLPPRPSDDPLPDLGTIVCRPRAASSSGRR